MTSALEMIHIHAEEGVQLAPSLPFSFRSENGEKNAICFASDRNYLPFTLVAIQSILQNASPEACYDIVILGTDCAGQEMMFQHLISERVNVRILDMEGYIEKFGMRDFHVSGNIPMAAYFRFFIPEIFAQYDKVLYLDGDVLACKDVNMLLSENMGNALVGCVRDVATFRLKQARQNYLEKKLGVAPNQYFCSGIMLYNIAACHNFGLSSKCIAKLKELVNPPYHDQDVLNAVTRGKVKWLPLPWHFITVALQANVQESIRQEPEAFAEYQKAAQSPGILHFAGAKPWNEDRSELADLWWAVADSTPVGPALRLRLSQLRATRLAEAVQLMGKPWLYLTYSFYKVFTLFVTGERRKESKRKSKLLKYLIRHGI